MSPVPDGAPRAASVGRLPAEPREWLRFERLLTRLSATFVNLPAEHVDGRIDQGLGQIVEFLRIERSSVAQFSDDGGELIVTHSYTVPGVDPVPRINLAPMWPWYTGKLRGGEVLKLTRLPDDLPPEAAQEREHYARGRFPQSHLAIPFKVGDAVLGAIGFGSFHRPYEWPDELVHRLQLVGEVFANALARVRAEEREARLRDQLTRVARVTLVGELAASIAHEVNQPLAAIIANAQAAGRLLAADPPDLGDVEAALAAITRAGQRAAAVIAGIRGFIQKAPGPRSPVDLNDVIAEILPLVRSELAQRKVGLKLEPAAGLPRVLGDRVLLQQVVLNLVANALDAMEPAAAGVRNLVIRSAAGPDGTVTGSVADTGSGLDPDVAPRVFEPFFTTKAGGMGMGLAICKSIVEAHGGRIGADPNPGSGTTVWFSLPVLREDTPHDRLRADGVRRRRRPGRA